MNQLWKTVRWCALAVFVAIPLFALFSQRFAGRAVWTIAITFLPLLFVLGGYYNWRRMCPLAWFAQLPTFLGRPGQRRASPWLQANYYYVTIAIFTLSLWLRLIATNGDGIAIATFFSLISIAALATGALFTGKTWCNYVCPVSVVEKIYTEPRGLRDAANSQCSPCTACKAACPDINEENGYWRDILSKPKRFAYFAFPGLVASFYFYYWFQSGTWDYYFSGSWANEPAVLATAFSPGHDAKTAGFFFLPLVPRAIAAMATLIAGAVVSVALFSAVERLFAVKTAEADARHRTFSVAAFTAFVTFYVFSGAPTLRLVPGATQIAQILFVTTATLFLVRRFGRQQADYAEETIAKQIIRRWTWKDVAPPQNLHDAFLIHKIRSEATAAGYEHLLAVYRDAIRESLATALVTRADVQRLESLRARLQISRADHEKIMADLAEEERARIQQPTLDVTGEKRLQLEAYATALRSHVERATSQEKAGDSLIRALRHEYGVTTEEHVAVVDALLRHGDAMGPLIARALEVMESALKTIHVLGHTPQSDARDLLMHILAARRSRAAKVLMRTFGSDDRLEERVDIPEGLPAGPPSVSAAVVPHLASADPYLRAAALYYLGSRSEIDQQMLVSLANDEDRTVRETADALMARRPERESITIERMMALRFVPLFASLSHEELALLARGASERTLAGGETLCRQGEAGDEIFIVLAGDVTVSRSDGGEEQVIAREKARSFIGELAVLDPAPRAATVSAGGDGARVLSLTGDAFRGLVRDEPALGEEVIRALVARIRQARLTTSGTAQAEPDTTAPAA